ncbi:MAG: hypothetical protein ABI624_24640, partial [Casimicrobiaceae bacterium]
MFRRGRRDARVAQGHDLDTGDGVEIAHQRVAHHPSLHCQGRRQLLADQATPGDMLVDEDVQGATRRPLVSPMIVVPVIDLMGG